jgi:hypothetical protein
VTRYTLHIPEQLNDGSPVGQGTFDWIERDLLDVAGGFTLTHGIGAWRGDDTVYREPVRLYSVDTADDVAAALTTVAQAARLALSQEAVYLTSTEIGTTLVYA